MDLDSSAAVRALLSALRALPEPERDVLLLVAWEQLTPAEAAAVPGVPQGPPAARGDARQRAARRRQQGPGGRPGSVRHRSRRQDEPGP